MLEDFSKFIVVHTVKGFGIVNKAEVDSYSPIKRNAFESVLMRWMKLEPIIQSEVCQEEKHQNSILTHIHRI